MSELYRVCVQTYFLSQLRKMLILFIRSHCKICPLPTVQTREIVIVVNEQILQWGLMSKINILWSWDKKYVYTYKR